ncbi:hypothetical protein [Streptomyces sp. NPDC057617]|uniref:hypothetical protein n=1 Tax=Streptomyces sp. NPDC057617 TaxID=3346184 RepID=UPI003685B586
MGDRLVSSTVDRALSVSNAESLLPDLAQILTTRILGHEKVEFPHTLNQITPDGLEPPPVRNLRRKLVDALLACGITAGQAMRFFVWLVVHEWEPRGSWSVETEGLHGDRFVLLDAGDFAWALHKAPTAPGMLGRQRPMRSSQRFSSTSRARNTSNSPTGARTILPGHI